MYGMISSTRLNGIDPRAYLRHVFERITEHSVNRFDELLPRNVSAQLAFDDAALRRAA